jgi:hypothetical protein
MVTWHPGFVHTAWGNARKHNKHNHQIPNKHKYESLWLKIAVEIIWVFSSQTVKDKILTWVLKSFGKQCCVMGQVAPAFQNNVVFYLQQSISKTAHCSVTQCHSVTSQTTYTSVITSHLARAKLLLRSNQKEWAWPCEHLQRVKEIKGVTKIGSCSFRFVNLHSEGINLHLKKVRKLVMCTEYKNLTKILQMVNSISFFVFTNGRFFFKMNYICLLL